MCFSLSHYLPSKHHHLFLPSAASVFESRSSCLHTPLALLERDQQEKLINSITSDTARRQHFSWASLSPRRPVRPARRQGKSAGGWETLGGGPALTWGDWHQQCAMWNTHAIIHIHKHTPHDASPGGVIGPYHVIKEQEVMRGWWQQAVLMHNRRPI